MIRADHRAMPHREIPRRAMPHRAMPHRAMPHRAMPQRESIRGPGITFPRCKAPRPRPSAMPPSSGSRAAMVTFTRSVPPWPSRIGRPRQGGGEDITLPAGPGGLAHRAAGCGRSVHVDGHRIRHEEGVRHAPRISPSLKGEFSTRNTTTYHDKYYMYILPYYRCNEISRSVADR